MQLGEEGRWAQALWLLVDPPAAAVLLQHLEGTAAGPRKLLEGTAAGPRKLLEGAAAGPRKLLEGTAAGPLKHLEAGADAQRLGQASVGAA